MIKFSYHRTCVGKPEKIFNESTKRFELWVNDKKINLGYGWITAELKFEEIYELLSVSGMAIAPALISDHRIEANFLSHEIILVDIDDGMTIDQLQEFPFYQWYGSGYYTTASHTDDAPRFRILYRLPIAITDPEAMRILYQGMLAIHGSADMACKDSSRLFYGTINAQHRELTDRMLDEEAISIILQAYDLAFKDRQKYSVALNNNSTQQFNPSTPEEIGELLDELKKYYSDLSYHARRDVTWAVASAVSNQDTINLMRARWNDSGKTMSYEGFVNDRKNSSIKIGTIYHMIRQHNPDFRKRTTLKNNNII